MILADHSQPVGFAFEAFETHVRVSNASLADRESQDASGDASRQHTWGTVRAVGALRPIIHMASIVKMIKGPNS
jgi:hypothetical protein